MRALTIWQPWASLLALGVKEWETRPWRATYRGPVAIHAARRGLAGRGLEIWREQVAAGRLGWDLPFGSIIALAELSEVRPIHELDALSTFERHLGDFTGPGRYAWRFTKIELTHPYPMRGRQRLWTIPSEIAAELRAARRPIALEEFVAGLRAIGERLPEEDPNG